MTFTSDVATITSLRRRTLTHITSNGDFSSPTTCAKNIRRSETRTKEFTWKISGLIPWSVRFQRKFYIPLALFFAFYIPTMVPVWYWNETLWNSFLIAGLGRYCYSLNVTWLVNSKVLIDMMALFGQAYDLKMADPELKKVKTGDGSRIKHVELTDPEEFCLTL